MPKLSRDERESREEWPPKESIELYVERQRDCLEKKLRRKGVPADQAEDAIQLLHCKLLRRHGGVSWKQDELSQLAWLAKVALNAWRDTQKRSRPVTVSLEVWTWASLGVEDAASGELSYTEKLEAWRDELRRRISRLDPLQQRIVARRIWKLEKFTAIAKSIDLPYRKVVREFLKAIVILKAISASEI